MENLAKKIDELAAKVTAKPNVSGKFPWRGECAIIVQPASFVETDSKNLLSEKSFNNKYAGKFKKKTPANQTATRDPELPRYASVCYRPGEADMVEENGRKLFNLYTPQSIEPLAGGPEIFLRHIEYLVPDVQSREYLLDWLAWLVQRPNRKMMFAVLLLGPHGTGKSWVAELMKVLLGAANCSEPDKKEVASTFNGWLGRRQLIIVHELYERNARGLADALKNYITQKSIRVNLKGVEAFEIENYANFLTITNHEDAIPIDRTERRWLVIRCTDKPMPPEYYTELFACIGRPATPGDEARRVLAYLQAREITLDGEGFAPMTEAREDVIEAGRSSLEKVLAEAYRARTIRSVFNPSDLLDSNELMQSVTPNEQNLRTVEKFLRNMRCRPIKVGPVRTKNGRKRLWARTPSLAARFAGYSHGKLAAMYEGRNVDNFDGGTDVQGNE